jgi:hypothetical protein
MGNSVPRAAGCSRPLAVAQHPIFDPQLPTVRFSGRRDIRMEVCLRPSNCRSTIISFRETSIGNAF